MEAGEKREGRPWAAVAGAALLLIAGVVVALTLSDSGDTGSAAPEECVSAWNDDSVAVSLGQHQYNDHGYNRVEISRLDPASLVTGADERDCTVIFPAQLLDPEPIAAAMVLQRGTWRPVSSVPGVTLPELGELQAEALDNANGSLRKSGVVEAD